MKKSVRKYLPAGVIGISVVAIWLLTPSESAFKQAAAWQQLSEPGKLSASHAFLENNCAACHTSVKGVPPSRCVVCHANNESILRRQPTAFHANVSSCTQCHREHQGRGHRPTNMDHVLLAKVGLGQLNDGDDTENNAVREQLLSWVRSGGSNHPGIKPMETILNCATCHANDDRHYKLFGSDCAQCHATDRWTIPEYRHPSPSSRDCSQCHQAPPSHYMMHFKMISARVAGKPHARIAQCFQCHQTTSWNDILGAGWYKHH